MYRRSSSGSRCRRRHSASVCARVSLRVSHRSGGHGRGTFAASQNMRATRRHCAVVSPYSSSGTKPPWSRWFVSPTSRTPSTPRASRGFARCGNEYHRVCSTPRRRSCSTYRPMCASTCSVYQSREDIVHAHCARRPGIRDRRRRLWLCRHNSATRVRDERHLRVLRRHADVPVHRLWQRVLLCRLCRPPDQVCGMRDANMPRDELHVRVRPIVLWRRLPVGIAARRSRVQRLCTAGGGRGGRVGLLWRMRGRRDADVPRVHATALPS
jgi:hypothetical protein